MSDNLIEKVKSFPEKSSHFKVNEKLLVDPIPKYAAAGSLTIDGAAYYGLAAALISHTEEDSCSFTFKASGWAFCAIVGAGTIAGGFYVDPKTLIG